MSRGSYLETNCFEDFENVDRLAANAEKEFQKMEF